MERVANARPEANPSSRELRRTALRALVESKGFGQVVMAVIVINAITLGLETSERAVAAAGPLLALPEHPGLVAVAARGRMGAEVETRIYPGLPHTVVRDELDWVAKYRMVEAYRARHDLPLSHPRVAMLDLAYHDVTRERSLYYLLERRGLMERVVTEADVGRALLTPPQTTRARPLPVSARACIRARRTLTSANSAATKKPLSSTKSRVAASAMPSAGNHSLRSTAGRFKRPGSRQSK